MIQPEVFRATLGDRLIGLRHSIDQLELEFAQLAADFERGDEWDSDGFNTAGDWIRINCNMNSNTVWNALTVGEHEADLVLTVEAVREGEIGYAHLVTMARTADVLGKAFDERGLLPLATRHSPGKFYRKALHYQHSVNAAAYAEDQEQKFEARSLRLGTTQDGCLLLSGILDPVGGAALRSALEPLIRKSDAHDDRTLEQRNADGLVELACGGQPASLQITASVDTVRGLLGAPAGETEFTLPVSSTAIQRMACDCSVTRVLLGHESNVVDVGRSTRVINTGLRKALEIRDAHCQWPTCERPASRCDGHHVVHWINGGETNLDNLALLCRRHHRLVHEGGWQLVRDQAGGFASIAPTITFGLPRGPDSN